MVQRKPIDLSSRSWELLANRSIAGHVSFLCPVRDRKNIPAASMIVFFPLENKVRSAQNGEQISAGFR